MPLVRIDVVEGRRTPGQLQLLADTVQELMRHSSSAPPRDRDQVVTEHRTGQLPCEGTGPGIERTDDLVVLQVFQQSRSESGSVPATPGRPGGRVRRPGDLQATSSDRRAAPPLAPSRSGGQACPHGTGPSVLASAPVDAGRRRPVAA